MIAGDPFPSVRRNSRVGAENVYAFRSEIAHLIAASKPHHSRRVNINSIHRRIRYFRGVSKALKKGT